MDVAIAPQTCCNCCDDPLPADPDPAATPSADGGGRPGGRWRRPPGGGGAADDARRGRRPPRMDRGRGVLRADGVGAGSAGAGPVLGDDGGGIRDAALLPSRSSACRRTGARARRPAGTPGPRDGNRGRCPTRLRALVGLRARRDRPEFSPAARHGRTRRPLVPGRPRDRRRPLARRPRRAPRGRPPGTDRVRRQRRPAAQPRRVRPRELSAAARGALGVVRARVGRRPRGGDGQPVASPDPRAGRPRLDARPALPGPARRAGRLRGGFHDAFGTARQPGFRHAGADVPAHGHAALFRHRRPQARVGGVPALAGAGRRRADPANGRACWCCRCCSATRW